MTRWAAWPAKFWSPPGPASDRNSTRLNSSHLGISYAVFWLKTMIQHLPVHGRGGLIEPLHAVHAAVAFAGLGVLGKNRRIFNGRPATRGPALQDRQILY